MAEAFRQARRGLYTTDPNPRVGCVIARDGAIVGRGWHRAAGQAHAEVLALAEAGDLARGATAYVTLEPCSHHGRTPPCSDALVGAGVARVVMADKDPNPLVDGCRPLAEAGITCESGLMADAAQALNPGFLSRMRSGRPWVRVKLATSLDGRTALGNGASRWITGPAARSDVQHWRARSSAVMTGIGTLLADDPALDLRLEGSQRQPLRVVCDSRWRTPAAARTLALPGLVLIAGLQGLEPPAALADSGAELLPLPASGGRLDLHALLNELGQRGVNELQVEAGATLCGALLEAGLVDEILLYQAASLLGDQARPAFVLPALQSMDTRPRLRIEDCRMLGEDLRLTLRPQRGTA